MLQELIDGTPDPALFFTLYCERARDIERETGSTEAALELLDFGLNGVGGCRLARRFITATRNSLLRYRAHLAALTAKLNSGEVEPGEKARLLETIRSLDWREFEKKSVRPSAVVDNKTADREQPLELVAEPEPEDFEDVAIDWSAELDIMEAILRHDIDEAFQLAQKSVYFPLPSLIKESSENQIWWLQEYCQCIIKELPDGEVVIPASLCQDPFSAAVGDEDTTTLLLLKTRIALNVLNKINKA